MKSCLKAVSKFGAGKDTAAPPSHADPTASKEPETCHPPAKGSKKVSASHADRKKVSKKPGAFILGCSKCRYLKRGCKACRPSGFSFPEHKKYCLW